MCGLFVPVRGEFIPHIVPGHWSYRITITNMQSYGNFNYGVGISGSPIIGQHILNPADLMIVSAVGLSRA
jgi:hypothetical protein